MRTDLLAMSGTGRNGSVTALRVELAHHPVHRWTASPADRTVLLAHVAFVHWAGATLASSLGVSGPGRQFDDACRALRRRGGGAAVTSFAAAVAAGANPLSALVDGDGPQAAGPLVFATGHLVTQASRAGRAGALILGLPGCVVDAPVDGVAAVGSAPAGDDNSRTPSDPGAARDAEDGARAMLVAQLSLLDGALHVIRQRHMSAHPTMWRHQTPPRLRLLPAS